MSREYILAHADELAALFESDMFDDVGPVPVRADDAAQQVGQEQLSALRESVVAAAAAERAIIDDVNTARGAGASWNRIGTVLGMSGEAARRRYAADRHNNGFRMLPPARVPKDRPRAQRTQGTALDQALATTKRDQAGRNSSNTDSAS